MEALPLRTVREWIVDRLSIHSPPAVFRVKPTYYDTGYAEAPWNLRRLLGYPGFRQAFTPGFYDSLYAFGRIPAAGFHAFTAPTERAPSKGFGHQWCLCPFNLWQRVRDSNPCRGLGRTVIYLYLSLIHI